MTQPTNWPLYENFGHSLIWCDLEVRSSQHRSRISTQTPLIHGNCTQQPPIYKTHFTYVDSIPKIVVKTKITWSPLPLAQRLPQRLPFLKNRFAILENFQTCAGCGRLWSELMYSCLLGGWSGVLLVLVVENSWQVETRLQQCFTLLTAWQRPPPPSSPPPPPPRSSCLRPAHSPPQSLPLARSQDEKATVRCLRRPSQHWRLLLAPPPPPCRPGHFCSSLHFNLLGGPPLVSTIFLYAFGKYFLFAWSFFAVLFDLLDFLHESKSHAMIHISF